MIFIVKGQDEIYLASKTDRITVVDAMVIVQDLDQSKSVKSCKDLYVLSEGAADITGSISVKVKC